ncbi:uncharacterized protein LOC141791725 [Halichoeres trimaculatus]|uniref:uncharacterized protein LOC141791725 n=1 Tax=Halichoeres trimaculatus TaxID=147232 RepID=UPI003D9F92DF
MGRYKCQINVWRNRGVTGERDIPAKLAPSRRTKFRKLPPIKHHEVEEPDQSVLTVISADPTLKSFKPIHSESVTSKGNTSSPVSPALGKPGHQVSPAGRPVLKMTPDQEKLSVRLEDITSSSMESDTTFSSDNDEEDCCSSSSSLPSPEIFRTESYIAMVTLTDQLAHHPYKKNSTLLDVSHAESIHMYHPPNLSTIIDGSSILPEKKGEINPLLGPEAETELKTTSLKPDMKRKF